MKSTAERLVLNCEFPAKLESVEEIDDADVLGVKTYTLGPKIDGFCAETVGASRASATTVIPKNHNVSFLIRCYPLWVIFSSCAAFDITHRPARAPETSPDKVQACIRPTLVNFYFYTATT